MVAPGTLTLHWIPGSGATEQQVFFGSAVNSTSYQTTLTGTATSYAIKVPAPGTFYWHINGRNSAGTTVGTKWKFTTVLPFPQPAQPKIAWCESAALPDQPNGSGGSGHTPNTRAVSVMFGYATRGNYDDNRKDQSASATKRVELCIVDSAGAATCKATTDARWLLYDSKTKPTGKYVPTDSNILDSTQTSFPAGDVGKMLFRLPDEDVSKYLDYGNNDNNGKFVILRVNNQPIDEARKLGGTCPVPYPLNASAHYEIYGTEDTVANPWAGKGFGDPCKSGGLYTGWTHCISTAAVGNTLTYLEGMAGDANKGWQPTRFGATGKTAWKNGDDRSICGDCKGHVNIYLGRPDGFAGMQYGRGLMRMDTSFLNDASTWSAPIPLNITTHELFHSLQGTYAKDMHMGFLEGTAVSVQRNACIQNLSQIPDRCISAGNLGMGVEALDGFIIRPANDQLSVPYESSLYWRYFMEQYALPVGKSQYARPQGGQPSKLESNPDLYLGHADRHSDEGADLLRLILADVEDAIAHGTPNPQILPIADKILSTRMKRNLDNLLFDFHTAALLKDYKGVPLEWRFEWLGDFNAAPADKKAPLIPKATVADPLEDSKPFQLPSDKRADGLSRVPRLVDRAEVGGSKTVSNATEAVINANGAAYLSVVPTDPDSTVTVRLRAAHHGSPRFRVFTVDADAIPTLVCTKETGTGSGRVRACEGDSDGNVSVDIATGSGKDAVKEILVVASAWSQPVSFFYQIGAGAPVIDVKGPSEGHKAWAGMPNGSARPLLVELVVRDADGNSIPGLDSGQLRLSAVTGSKTTIITDVRWLPLSGGVYFARATLPASAIPNIASDLDLKAEYLDQKGTEVLASDLKAKALTVKSTGPTVSTEMVLDLSTSMKGDKLTSLKTAADFALDAIPDGDEVGIIRYINDAKEIAPIDVVDQAHRDTLKIAIEGLTPGGCTSIGDGLLEAQSLFNVRYGGASAVPNLNLLLLTDGMNTANFTPSWYYSLDKRAETLPYQHDGDGVTTCKLPDPDPSDTNPWTAGSLNWHYQALKPFVTAIGLGQDADLTELSNLANSTKGTFLYAEDGGVGKINTTTHALANVFLMSHNAVSKSARIDATRADSLDGTPSFRVEKGARSIQVSVLSLSETPDRDLVLYDDTNGVGYERSYATDTAAVYRVQGSPIQDGTWTLRRPLPPPVTSPRSVSLTVPDPPVFIEAVVSSPLALFAFADVERAVSGGFEGDDERWVGKDVYIRAIPTDGGDLTGVLVSATVTDPSGASSSITLLDDGKHADGAANDGVYGTVIEHPTAAGAYAVDITASGETTSLGKFKRKASVGFSLHPAPDADGDGVPDWCDPQPHTPDANQDPDRDGLTNAQECAIGTNPLKSDSDEGGDDDGPEVAAGRNPRDRGDDQGHPIMIHVSPCKGKVLITPEVPITSNVEILVSNVGSLGPYSVAYTGPGSGSFTVAAPTGSEKCYRMRLVGATGASWSPPACIATSTAQTDPHPPTVKASLKDGTMWALSHHVELLVNATDSKDGASQIPRCTESVESGVKDMQVSFTADFAGATWLPYSELIPLDLPAGEDTFFVWVRVRDGAGNVSAPALVVIRLAATQATDFLVYGLIGARLEDGVTLVSADGGRGTLASEGINTTEIGAQAIAGNVLSRSSVFLRAGGRIEGNVDTGAIFERQDGATVTGTVTEGARLGLSGFRPVYTQPGTGTPITLERGKSMVLAPGNYGDLTLRSGSKLTLQSGVYQFKVVQIEPDAQVILMKTWGPTRLYMESLVHRGTILESGAAYGQTLFAVLGPAPVFIEGPFIGTLLAPIADATIGTAVAQEHRGAFHAQSVLVRSRTTLRHVPWSYDL